MSVIHRLLILGILLIAATPGARAASGDQNTPVALANGNTLVLYGLTFSISGCSANCAGLQLANVAAGRGNIEFQVVSPSGSGTPILSRAVNAGNNSTTLSFTIGVAQTMGQPTTQVSSAKAIVSGIRDFTCSTSHSGCATGIIAQEDLNFSNITIT